MEKLKAIVKSIADVKASDIRIYDTRDITPFFDYVVIASCLTSRQMDAAISHLKKDSLEKGFSIRGIEGQNGGYWVLIDAETVLVNLFLPEEREKYDLDKLLKDLPQIAFREDE